MTNSRATTSTTQVQNRLVLLAVIFMLFYSIALTLAPAVRERTFDTIYRWEHWVGFSIWLVTTLILHYQIRRHQADADPYLLPIACLLVGWGLMTIWRLDPYFGYRQTIWLFIAGLSTYMLLRYPSDLRILYKYKYIILSAGLILTAMTLIFGTNPLGNGPRLWLGCCGIYLQPSEPLKLILIIFLAAFLTDRQPFNLRPFSLFVPTFIFTGIALLLLLVQRDLGTASIFLLIYTVILYISVGRKRILLVSLSSITVAGLIGYFSFAVVRLRIDSWINPWIDPSGRSYQIVQSLLAIANGGVFGRGPGIGSPSLVPVTISDFIFAAIGEEMGLTGSLALFILIAILSARGIRVALQAPDQFRRLLATGVTAFIAIQSILIIGGNIRLLPLTGVTLPFLSYGGSSLLTSFAALFLLIIISSQTEKPPAKLGFHQPQLVLTGLLGAGLSALALVYGWWAIVRGPDLLTRTDNARRSIADRYVQRGSLLDRRNTPINISEGNPGSYVRVYLYPQLAATTGYTQPTYGQAGLEASLDPYLRGLQGNPASLITWQHLLYGQPPPGLDVRLSIDLTLQSTADNLLKGHGGALVLINASTGEILALASHPTYDPNNLEAIAADLFNDPNTPLLNRATQGQYPPGSALIPFYHAAGIGEVPGNQESILLFERLGFFELPELRLELSDASEPGGELLISPLQLALAAATLSQNGAMPRPLIELAVRTPEQGWVVLNNLSESVQVFEPSTARATAEAHAEQGQLSWGWIGSTGQGPFSYTWYLGGTLPDWQGTPLSLVVLLEGEFPGRARVMGIEMLNSILRP
ncbi:MAG: FtsW/RodA/SpoVE family cell cycle protein [Chloroflexota bacterium]